MNSSHVRSDTALGNHCDVNGISKCGQLTAKFESSGFYLFKTDYQSSTVTRNLFSSPHFPML